MTIALINGSPRKNSASASLIHDLKPLLGHGNQISEFRFNKHELSTEEIDKIGDCNVLVFVFPLYVDGIPSHLLRCLVQLESYLSRIVEKNIVVYSVVNCGFYEGHQCALALEMMKHWSAKAGARWGRGLGFGAGGMLLAVNRVPVGYGPKKSLGNALKQLSEHILKQSSGDDMFVSANFPRFLYKLAAEMGWRNSIKANGLSKRDLFLRK